MKSIAIIFLLVVIAGCTSNVSRSTISGDFKTLVEEGQKKQNELLTLPTNELWAYCQAFVKSRVFTPVEDCFNEIDKRFKAADNTLLYLVQGLFDTHFIAPGVFGEGMITELKLEAAMAQGDQQTAALLAEHLYGLTIRYAYPYSVTTIEYQERYPAVDDFDESGYGNIYRLKQRVLALGTLGLIAARNGEFNRAAANAEEIAAIDASSTNAAQWRLPQAKALWLGRIYMTLGDYENAYQHSLIKKNSWYEFLDGVNTALDIIGPFMYVAMVEAYGDTDYRAALNFTYEFEPRFLRHQAELETGRLQAAKAGYEAIIKEPKVRGFGTVYWQALHGLGRISELQGNISAALDYYERAIQIIERQRKSLDSEAGRMGFVNDKQIVYGDIIALLSREGQHIQAFSYAERAKARALVDLLASKSTFSGNVDARTQVALRQAEALENQALASEVGLGDNATRGISVQLKAIEQQAPEVASLITVTEPSVTAIQSHLGAHESLLVYYYAKQSREAQLFTFIVNQHSVKSYSQPLASLGKDIAGIRDAIKQTHGSEWSVLATRLYTQLVAPFVAGLADTKRLIVVPHGALHYLPFNVLQNNQGLLLSEQYTLRLLPAASVLEYLNHQTSGEQLLTLANPDLNQPELDLPGAQREAQEIAQLWTDNQTFVRQQASESLLKSQAQDYQYIHLASHGAFDAEEPLQSRLFLAPDIRNDGYLTVPEIYDLQLNARLVVLSACETGLGDISQGDDVVGLNRGFLFAGANGIVSSLWQVPDEATTLLMTRFYAYLKSEPPASALSKAQRETRERFPHPYFWAAFQLTGGA